MKRLLALSALMCAPVFAQTINVEIVCAERMQSDYQSFPRPLYADIEIIELMPEMQSNGYTHLPILSEEDFMMFSFRCESEFGLRHNAEILVDGVMAPYGIEMDMDAETPEEKELERIFEQVPINDRGHFYDEPTLEDDQEFRDTLNSVVID